MKGVKVIRAAPSNAIDIYPLFVDAAKAGSFDEEPTGLGLKQYYFKAMIDELANPTHFWLLARRGRGFIGFLHAMAIPRRWDGIMDSLYVEVLFVDEKYRNRGVSAKLIEELKKYADNVGIKKLRFSCPEALVKHCKKYKAEAVRSLMEVNL